MLSLRIIVIICVVQCFSCLAPYSWYESHGPNQLFVQQGKDVKTVSGALFIKGFSAEQCAKICSWMNRECPCCNSFAYKPSDKTCYLKQRGEDLNDEVKTNSDGWQSYRYWGSGYHYDGDLPMSVQGPSDGAPFAYWYDVAYISMGAYRNAEQEGESIKTSQGLDFLTNASPRQCAEDCDAIIDCDGFAYDPFQNEGTCYLKKNSQNKYITVHNSDGWTYYWKELDWQEKCFCTCGTNAICIMCNQDEAKCDAI